MFLDWLLIIFTRALVSAILSAVDSALLAVSAVVTESGYRRLRPEASPAAMLRAARLATGGAAAVAAVLAMQGESLRNLVLGAGAITAQIGVLGVLDWGVGLPGAFL